MSFREKLDYIIWGLVSEYISSHNIARNYPTDEIFLTPNPNFTITFQFDYEIKGDIEAIYYNGNDGIIGVPLGEWTPVVIHTSVPKVVVPEFYLQLPKILMNDGYEDLGSIGYVGSGNNYYLSCSLPSSLSSYGDISIDVQYLDEENEIHIAQEEGGEFLFPVDAKSIHISIDIDSSQKD